MTDERKAVALSYEDPGDGDGGGASRVLARGSGALAERIIATARAHDVPIQEDRDLVALLAASELSEETPVALYTAVAEILAFLYRTNAAAGD